MLLAMVSQWSNSTRMAHKTSWIPRGETLPFEPEKYNENIDIDLSFSSAIHAYYVVNLPYIIYYYKWGKKSSHYIIAE